ncbi:MAG: hypothetical protein MUF18_02220 [Fimbriiglobus sp.]|nr:hypothetical protein [Fimbriiglobus sp.]
MSRIFTLGLIFVVTVEAALAVAAKPPPVPAARVTVHRVGTLAEITAEIGQQAGITFDLSSADAAVKVEAKFDTTPVWEAVEKLAEQSGHFVGLIGNKVKLTRRPNGVAAVPSAIDGPFRVVLKRVIARRDPERADTEYELQLEVQWEPRFPVYLIDTEPKATATVSGKTFVADAVSVRVVPTGSTQTAVVRLKNVPREAKQLEELTGTFRVVAAAKVLAFEFADLTGEKPVSVSTDGVRVTLQPAQKLEKGVQFAVSAEYPNTHPEFESFQFWHGSNTFRLFPPNDRTGRKPTDQNLGEGGRRPSAEYAFTGMAAPPDDRKGWRAVYETPCPMAEQEVKFTLKALKLP